MLKPKGKIKDTTVNADADAVAARARRKVRIAEMDADDEADAKASSAISISGDVIQAAAEKMLKLSVFEPEVHYRLNTGSPYLNATFGSRDTGIAYGKLIEVGGPEHTGKTLIDTILIGMAQRDGAAAGYIDLEESRDGLWAAKLGADWDAVTKFYPKLVRQKKGPPILMGAEDVCEQAEQAMYLMAQHGADKQIWFLDSVAMLQTSKQLAAGLTGITMNTRLARADFLSTMLPRWVGLAANYNAIILLSNQLRSRIGGFVMPGMEDETTGGKALRHACSIRVRTRRVKGGRLRNGKSVVGLAGCLRNIKNKSGDGSVEGCECGFKVLWNRPKASIEFTSIEDLKKEMGGEDN